MKAPSTILFAIILLFSGCISFNQRNTFNPTLAAIITKEAVTMRAELTKINLIDQKTPIPPSIVSADTWLELWLSSPTCQPPCWENITPGMTIFNTAVRIVSGIPGISIDGLFMTPALIDNNTTVNWDFGENGYGSIRADFESKIVKEILLVPEGNYILTVKDLVTSYGNPDALITSWCFGEYFTSSCPYVLLYKELGLVAYLDVGEEKSVTIKPDTQIVFINLSPQNDIKIFDNKVAKLFEIQWDGYKTYNFQR